MDSLSFLKLKKVSFFIVAGCLALIFFSSFDLIVAKTRDVKRRADFKVLTSALDIYYDKHGYYPEGGDDWRGWNMSYHPEGREAHFLESLKNEKIIDKDVRDPINDQDFYYRYQKYPAGSYGCAHPFYILQILSFGLTTNDIGQGKCPEMDWTELAPNGYTVQVFGN